MRSSTFCPSSIRLALLVSSTRPELSVKFICKMSLYNNGKELLMSLNGYSLRLSLRLSEVQSCPHRSGRLLTSWSASFGRVSQKPSASNSGTPSSGIMLLPFVPDTPTPHTHTHECEHTHFCEPTLVCYDDTQCSEKPSLFHPAQMQVLATPLTLSDAPMVPPKEWLNLSPPGSHVTHKHAVGVREASVPTTSTL